MWYAFHSFPVQLAFSLRREALCVLALALVSGIEFGFAEEADDAALTNPRHWIWSKAHAIPKETTSEESGYFSIVEGKSGKIYIGTAKYGDNAFLVEFDPKTAGMSIVVDAEKEIGVDRKGFAAQAKFHTRNNVGRSGKIYLGTKQGYPKEGETLTDYPGGHPMVFDPASGETKVYDIPVPHQGIASVTPDESRGLAYISTCSDGRPSESSHFLILSLETGAYRDLMDCRHVYAFIVVDHLGRAYHPVRGGKIARYDPETDRLDELSQTIDGKAPGEETHLADPDSHPINWEISPDLETLYAVAMSHNALFAYDLTGEGSALQGRSVGPLVKGAQTDCRAMYVAPDGTVWAGVMATLPGQPQLPRLVSFTPGDKEPIDHGPMAIGNPDYTDFQGSHQHGVHRPFGDHLIPRYVIMGICAATDGTVYLTTLYPFTVHAMKIPEVAGITTVYHHNSHSDVILTRLLKTDTLDGNGQPAPMALRSLYVDQVGENDLSRRFANEHGVPIAESVEAALADDDEALAVDGVLLVAEHGNYPRSNTGQIMYPKRRLFGEIADLFRRTGRSVPVFCDKHLADNWTDAKWLYDTARELDVPLMAGSSLPVLWRHPAVDVRRGAKLIEVVALSYGSLDAYGFHGLEMVQSLIERRAGGETGVASVQCMTGKAAWDAGRNGVYDRALLDAALSRLKRHPLPEGADVEELCPDPVLFVVDYRDGLRVSLMTPGTRVNEWAVAWRYAEEDAESPGQSESTTFWTQEARPFMHFTYLNLGIEKMMHTGRPAWPAERTLLTSGILDAVLRSKRDGGVRLETPWLDVVYRSDWDWKQPPPPPPGRPIHSQ